MVGGLALPDGIQVSFAAGDHDVSPQALLTWINDARQAMDAYYGAFPVPSLKLNVSFTPGRQGVSHGKTFGNSGALIRISVGQHTTEADLHDDWVLVHEMVHLGFPSVGEDQHWMEEGSATYIEPIARVMTGNLTPKKVWSDLVRDMPKGVPAPGDEGLDLTHSWASTYWGGALFCLIADVEIRTQTHAAKGLQHAFQAIVKQGGNILADWPIDKAFRIGDEATGTNVLRSLYQRMGRHHMNVDLPALFAKLGVVGSGSTLHFDESAPLAYLRRAIMPSRTPDHFPP